MKSVFKLSKSRVFEQLSLVRGFSDEVSYSVKSNLEVADVLQGECSFSVHSFQNLEKIKEKDNVWYFLQGNNGEQIKDLIQKGVRSFVVDNRNDLRILLDNLDVEINLLLRMKLKEHTLHTGKHFVFGFSSKETNELLKELKENNKINKLGIHFHRKTQNVSEWNLKEELEDSIKDWSLINYVNIGGGIPVEYKNFRKEVIENIFSRIKELREFLNAKDIKMIIEPGRFIAGPSIRLETEVVNVYDGNVVLNCSVYNSAMDTFVNNIRLLVEGEKEQGYRYVLKGCSPDSVDIFRYSVFLDKELKVGDRIVFLNAGAYNFNSNYSNLEKVETVLVE